AGNDLILTSTDLYTWTDPDPQSAADVTILRTAAHNILYAVANSNSVNAKVTGYIPAWWKWAIIGLDVAAAGLIALWGVKAFKKAKKEKQA
ncbi:MAG: hypothetical protein ILP12_01920, partial [Lachnospiraceae bacterium]|nr:hypothetical protein [Lachnospiraceae bacterium]